MNRIAKLDYWAKPGVTRQGGDEITRNRLTTKEIRWVKKSEKITKIKKK